MRISLLAVIVFFYCACSSEQGSSRFGNVMLNPNFQPDSSKQRLLKIIEGGWVNEAYMQVLENYKSPMMAASIGLPIQQLTFDCSNMSGDTLLNSVSRLKFDEGVQFDIVFFRQEDGKTGMRAVNDRTKMLSALVLNYSIEGKDTILLLNYFEGKSAHTSRFHRQFRELEFKEQVSLSALEYFVNQKLFTGKWRSDESIVVLSNTGEVKYFGTYQRYSILTNDDHPGSRADEISFYNDSTNVTYAFAFDQNHLRLFEIQESDDGKSLSRGRQVFDFIKIP